MKPAIEGRILIQKLCALADRDRDDLRGREAGRFLITADSCRGAVRRPYANAGSRSEPNRSARRAGGERTQTYEKIVKSAKQTNRLAMLPDPGVRRNTIDATDDH